ncbi:MAG: RNA polymerase sigma factor [Planctomycetota bacterium]
MRSELDQELMREVQRGDLAAFEQIVERHHATVYGLAFSMLRSREDAEETTQDTFVKLFRARDSFDLSRRLEPWLLRIAGNTCRDQLRRRKVERRVVATEADQLAHLLVDDSAPVAERREATRQAVRLEVDRLSDRLRMPLVLRYVEGLNNQQIADALGISVSNVKVRMARAKDLLQGRLEKLKEGA